MSQITKRKDAQDSDLAPFWGDLSQSEKNSEIKPPLVSSKKVGRFFLCSNYFGLFRLFKSSFGENKGIPQIFSIEMF